MKVSVVMTVRKINDFVRESIPYILKQTHKNFEIIVLSEIKGREKWQKTKIIKIDKMSPAAARNLGVEKAKGEIIAFIDDDAYPDKKWVENGLKYFKDKKIGAVAGPGLNPKNAGFKETLSGLVYETSGEKTGIRYKKGKKQEVDDWPTCNLLIRKKDYLACGGFSTQYWGGEDTQLCYNLTQKLGKKIIYDPEVIVYHHRRDKIRKHLKQSYFWGLWRGFFIREYPETSRKITYMIPAFFVFFIVLGFLLSFFSIFIKTIYISILILYFFFLIFIGAQTNLKYFFPVIFLSFLTQIVYGLGIMRGFLSKVPTKRTFNPRAEKIK